MDCVCGFSRLNFKTAFWPLRTRSNIAAGLQSSDTFRQMDRLWMESRATIIYFGSSDCRSKRWECNGNGYFERKLFCEFHWPDIIFRERVQYQRAKYCHHVEAIECVTGYNHLVNTKLNNYAVMRQRSSLTFPVNWKWGSATFNLSLRRFRGQIAAFCW